MSELTNAVIFPQELRRIIDWLQTHPDPFARLTAATLEETWHEQPGTFAYAAALREQYPNEGDVNIDDHPAVAIGSDPGAYVQAWIWVPNESL